MGTEARPAGARLLRYWEECAMCKSGTIPVVAAGYIQPLRVDLSFRGSRARSGNLIWYPMRRPKMRLPRRGRCPLLAMTAQRKPSQSYGFLIAFAWDVPSFRKLRYLFPIVFQLFQMYVLIQIAASRLLREVPQAPFERMIASCGCAFEATLSHRTNPGNRSCIIRYSNPNQGSPSDIATKKMITGYIINSRGPIVQAEDYYVKSYSGNCAVFNTFMALLCIILYFP